MIGMCAVTFTFTLVIALAASESLRDPLAASGETYGCHDCYVCMQGLNQKRKVLSNLLVYIWVIPCQLIHFFADPSPILMKFGKLGGQQKKLIHTKFQHISTIFNGVRAL